MFASLLSFLEQKATPTSRLAFLRCLRWFLFVHARLKEVLNKAKLWVLRVSIVLLASVSPFISSGCREDKQLTKITLLTDWFPQPEHGGFYNALVKGYYEDVGLKVEIIPGGLYAFTIDRVAHGEAEFGMGGSEDMLLAVEQGAPVVAIGATMQRSPLGIMVHAESPVLSFEDLEGKSIAATPGIGWYNYISRKYGLKNLNITQLSSTMDDFFENPDSIQQVFVTSETFFAEKRGIPTRVLLVSDSGYNPYRVVFGSKTFIQAHPDITRSFMLASIRGWRDYLKNPRAAHREIKNRNPKKTDEFLEYSWKKLREYHFVTGDPGKEERIGTIDPDRWRQQYQILRDLDIVKHDFDPMRALSTSFF